MKDEAETSSCESAVDMIAAMIAERRMPAKTRARTPVLKMPLIITMKHFSGSLPTSASVRPRCFR